MGEKNILFTKAAMLMMALKFVMGQGSGISHTSRVVQRSGKIVQ